MVEMKRLSGASLVAVVGFGCSTVSADGADGGGNVVLLEVVNTGIFWRRGGQR